MTTKVVKPKVVKPKVVKPKVVKPKVKHVIQDIVIENEEVKITISSKVVKIRINPNHINEFIDKIKEIDEDDYHIIKVSEFKENRISEEFNDWKYEYKNDATCYFHYPLYEFSINKNTNKILSEIFNKKHVSSQSLWYKKQDLINDLNPDIDDTKGKHQNRFTIYVITKGRWETNYTIKSLLNLGIENYKVVIETQEVDNYIKSGVDKEKIIPFEKEDKQNKSGIPVRNFVWDYSIKQGEKYHWILDDNIENFYRWNRNKRTIVKSGFVFTHIEDYTMTKTNVVMSGMNYHFDNPDIDYGRDLMIKNTRIYSCILIKNDIPKLEEKWRGLYNEDTDLSIRILKHGYGTMLFNNYLCGKKQTGKIKGGNQELYKNYSNEGYKIKTLSLIEQHPTLVKFKNLKNKPDHHQVDYSSFKENSLHL